jgi:Helix-hairpin-helix motif
MPNKVRVNLANPLELLELPGIGPEQALAILEFRAQHGPIQDARQLATILHPWPVAEAIWERVEFDPAESTSPRGAGGVEPSTRKSAMVIHNPARRGRKGEGGVLPRLAVTDHAQRLPQVSLRSMRRPG